MKAASSDVYVMRIIDGIKDAMSRLCSSLEFPTKLSSVVIKLNLCDYRRPETGAVSDPEVVDALLGWIRSKYPTCDIALVETDASTARADVLFRWLGFDSLAEKHGARTINLAKGKWISKQIPGYLFDSAEVPAIVEDADLLITHPKLKTHSLTKFTCGLKNMYGCFRPTLKTKYHPVIDKLISDINLAMPADLSIVDANICHEGIAGPASGNPKRLGLLVGGSDIVAVDAFCARLAGFSPASIPHIRNAFAKGLGNLDYRIQGDDISAKLVDGSTKLEFDKRMFTLIRLARLLGVGAI